MSVRLSLRKIFKGFVRGKQDKSLKAPAVMGNGAGEVLVADSPGRVYVTFADGSVAEVYNAGVAPQINQTVWVSYDPAQPGGVMQITGTRVTPVREEDALAQANKVLTHHLSHEWLQNGGGTDPVMVDLRQFTPVRLGFADGLNVYVYRGVFWAGGAWRVLESTSKIDLEDEVPDTEDYAAWVLVTIDESGAVATTTGSEVEGSSITFADIPDAPVDTAYVVGAVLLWYGQTQIVESRYKTDIVDLRFPGYHPVSILADGSAEGRRKKINFVSGANVEVTAVDNPGEDRVDVTIASEQVTELAAEDITVETTNFDGVLSGSDTDVQTALETIDDLDINALVDYYEPVTNGDAENPEIVFDETGDVVMGKVDL